MIRHISSLVLVVAGMVIVAGCDLGSSTAASRAYATEKNQPRKGTIAYSAMTLRNPFFKTIADSLGAEAKKHGYALRTDDAQRNVDTQAEHVDMYIAAGVSAIVLNPVDRVAVGESIRKANEKGIPVFTNDLKCIAEGVHIAGHVGTDNYQGGELAGKAMIEALGEQGGKVAILHFKQAHSCVLRVNGFRKAIETHNRGRRSGTIDIVRELDGGGLRDEGLRAAAAALQMFPDLRGIFAINDPSALGARKAVEEAGKDEQVAVVGFDGQIEARRAILDGDLYASLVQFPSKMGEVTAANIAKYMDGEEYEREQLIPTALYKLADARKDPEL